MKETCEVTNCPALRIKGRSTCGPHTGARLAEHLNIAETLSGRGGQRCIDCGRVFKKGDYVWKEMRKRAIVKRKGDPYGYAHVACEPRPPRQSRRLVRESEKPLFAGEA